MVLWEQVLYMEHYNLVMVNYMTTTEGKLGSPYYVSSYLKRMID
jgi:hypothetical protein